MILLKWRLIMTRRRHRLFATRNTGGRSESDYYLWATAGLASPMLTLHPTGRWGRSVTSPKSMGDFGFRVAALCPRAFHALSRGVRLKPGEGPVEIDSVTFKVFLGKEKKKR